MKELTPARRAGKVRELEYTKDAALLAASTACEGKDLMTLTELADLHDIIREQLTIAARADKRLAEMSKS